ncbi:MAG TPA: fatty acid desaturase [Thermoanaerobaculia bacterium]|nr:fatty acid desaturase [Thermoanaerobaculia bacterium]
MQLPGIQTTHAHDHKWERGYKAPAHARDFLKKCHQTRPWLTVLTALSDHAVILALAAGVYWAYLYLHPAFLLVLYPLAAIGIVRSMRGLENLVHEGSHFNWSRSDHGLNDLLCNLLAAVPVFSDVVRYRPGHKLHHFSFGTDEDADLGRYQVLAIEEISRRNPIAFAAGIVRRIVAYVIGWWKVIQTRPAVLGKSLLWHAVFLILPAALALGLGTALALWLAFWIGPFLLLLPWHRFVAEAGKHQYEGQETVFDATISNIGFVHHLLLHPHSDGYHLLHHLFPGIPHHQLARAHRGLAQLDPGGYGEALRLRTHILEDPEPARRPKPAATPPPAVLDPVEVEEEVLVG